MPFSKFIMIPVLLGVQAAILMLIAPFVPGSTAVVGGPGLLIFVSFQAWAVYFAAGCTPKDGVKVVLAYLSGIAVSIAIILMGDAMATAIGGYWAYALAVFIAVIPAISLERVPMFNFIPGLFIGSGMFFAIITLGGSLEVVDGVATRQQMPHTWESYRAIAVPEMIGCIVGQIFGFITVTWRSAYEAAMKTE